MDNPGYTAQRVDAASNLCDIFLGIGNTGAAVERLWTGNEKIYAPAPASHHTRELNALINMGKITTLTTLRHPDPKLSFKMKVNVPGLQVLGSWKKLKIRKASEDMAPRLNFTSFIWNS